VAQSKPEGEEVLVIAEPPKPESDDGSVADEFAPEPIVMQALGAGSRPDLVRESPDSPSSVCVAKIHCVL
jgi:hypothetical protein